MYFYFIGKLLTFVYIPNLFTWHRMQPPSTMNFTSMYGVLAVVGVLLMSMPRYYVELEWFQLQHRLTVDVGNTSPKQVEDFRPEWMRHVAHLLDSLLLTSFALSFVAYVYDLLRT